MITPLYRALLEASLGYDGVLEPSVSADGHFSDESGSDLLGAEDGLTLILSALIRADAAIGATVGKEVFQSLAENVGVERGVDAVYDDLRRDGHVFSNDAVETVVYDAARAFAAQHSIEAQ